MQNSESLRRVLELAAELLGVDSATAREVRLPHRTTLTVAQQRLDLLAMHWRRFCFGEGVRMAASWQCDASEQFHYDYFCQRLDTILVPPDATPRGRLRQADLTSSFHRLMLPLSVLGVGETSLGQKVKRVIHAGKLWAGEKHWDTFRYGIRGMCSDQGTEKALCDCPNVDKPEHVARALMKMQDPGWDSSPLEVDWLFPRALWVAGPLHQIWNAFETAIKASPRWNAFEVFLKAMLAFLGHTGI